ncbi:MAG: DNA cytosine methyltransferase [Alphaproteobacteria bacterium]|nr:DNA cytosine methyltransferase [Alphaproteobacteria bacterium]
MQRRRFYLVASRRPVTLHMPEPVLLPLATFLDPDPPAHTELDADFLRRFGDALHVVDAADPEAVACCFTGAYGRSPVYAGSYLRQDGRVRRFSPSEVARLMGFPEGFSLPEDPARSYRLLGNSLAVPVVRVLLQLLEDPCPP